MIYNNADQAGDAKRFSEFLAEDFMVQTPGVTRTRDEYLEYIAKPRPFKDLALLEAKIRIRHRPGDVPAEGGTPADAPPGLPKRRARGTPRG